MKMKKNKRQLKREKKNQRRVKELERQNKKVVSSCTHIKVDGMGNITRLINKKGSVLPTETKMYGCEIEKSVPHELRRMVDKLGLDVMIRVPIQTNGLTGSGKPSQCHSNVLGLVKWKGGKILIGYNVIITDEGYGCVSHSVWISPENKCKNVTKIYSIRTETDDSITKKGDKEYILFIPVGLGMIDEMGVGLYTFSFTKKWEKTGITVNDNSGDPPLFVPIKRLDYFEKECGFINQNEFQKCTNTIKKIKEWLDRGGFSNKSLGTGKYWDEIKTEIVW